MDGESWYDVAQVCLDGHVSNANVQAYPAHNKKFCADCGKPTITQCSACNTPLRGEYHVRGISMVSRFTPAAFCHGCGKPYPWTEERVRVAKQLADEADNLDESDKETLKETFADLVHESPRTTLAASRFKRLAKKAGDVISDGLRTVLFEVASEAAKRQLWPGS
jgi:hypothetical protein